MVFALLVFALNGLYQHRSWWRKGGKELMYEDIDAVTSMPSITSGRSQFGGSFQVRSSSSSSSSRSQQVTQSIVAAFACGLILHAHCSMRMFRTCTVKVGVASGQEVQCGGCGTAVLAFMGALGGL
jgi:hypothetical protein